MPKKTMVSAPLESSASAASAAATSAVVLGDAQVRQPARAVVLLQGRKRGCERVEPSAQLHRRQPIFADGALEAAVDRLRIGSRARLRALIRAHGREP